MDEFKCACPHQCSQECFFCKANYDFIVEEPITSKACGHFICKQCVAKIKDNPQNCAVCSKENRSNIMEKIDGSNPTIERFFKISIEKNVEEHLKQLKDKMKSMEGYYFSLNLKSD